MRVLVLVILWAGSAIAGVINTKTPPFLSWVEQQGNGSVLKGVQGDPSDFVTPAASSWSVDDDAHLWSSVAADPTSNNLYLLDPVQRTIFQSTLGGTPTPVLTSLASNIGDIAYDWLVDNLYWTDTSLNRILMAPVNNPDLVKTVVLFDTDRPTSLALSPSDGLIIFSTVGILSKIQSIEMSGVGRRRLVTDAFTGGHPADITIDAAGQRFFWCTQTVVEVMNFDGSDRNVVYTMDDSNFVKLTYYNEYVFVLDNGGDGESVVWFLDLTTSITAASKLQLAGTPLALTFVNSLPASSDNSQCDSCDQICISDSGGASECDCQNGYSLNYDGESCDDTYSPVQPGPLIVYGISDRLCWFPITDITTSNVGTMVDVQCTSYSIDGAISTPVVNFNNGGVYFVVHAQYPVAPFPLIGRFYFQEPSSSLSTIFGGCNAPGLAINWPSDNMYWTDQTRGVIMVSRVDGRFEKTLISNLPQPYGLAVDPVHRKICWSEQGSKSIRFSDLDGSNVQTLVSNSYVVKPLTVHIDFAEWKLYWLEASGTVHFVDMDGDNHQQFVPAYDSDTHTVIDFTLYQNFLILSANANAGSKLGASLYFVDKRSGVKLQKNLTHTSDFPQIGGVAAYAPDNEPQYSGDLSQSCAWNNGGCDQLCFESDNSHSCACTAGQVLASDGHSCVPASDILQDQFFLLTDDYKHRILQADSDMSNMVTLFSPGLDLPYAITYDFKDSRVYWSDWTMSDTSAIFSANLDGSDIVTIVEPSYESVFSGLAFDSRTQLLYYVDSGLNVTGVIAVKGGYKKVLNHYTGGRVPESVALDTVNNIAYYTVVGKQSYIEQRALDSSFVGTFINSKVSTPGDITVDQTEKRVYWSDIGSQTIESAALNGSGRRVDVDLSKVSNAYPYSVASVPGYIYYSDWSNYFPGVHQVAKNGSSTNVLGSDLISSVKYIKYFDKSLSQGSPTACSVNNGGCSHICFPFTKYHVCACPDNSSGQSVTTIDGSNCPTPSNS